jgi:hypothetical protein
MESAPLSHQLAFLFLSKATLLVSTYPYSIKLPP